MNFSNVVLTFEKSSSVVCLCFEFRCTIVVSNDCITNTTRHSTRSTGLIFCVEFESNLQRLHGSVARRNKTRGIACAQHLFLCLHILYTLSATRVHSMMTGLTIRTWTSPLIHNQIRGCNLERFECEEGCGHSQAYNTH